MAQTPFTISSSVPSGEFVAQLFIAEATKHLSTEQIQQTRDFMKDPFRGNAWHRPTLQRILGETLDDFYSKEVAISGGPQDRLTAPGGSPDAALGLILHVQSEDDAIGEFYDPRSATINMLAEKGVTSEVAFGYDWHWRAQGRMKRGDHCPAKKWSSELKTIHDQVSWSILQKLPLPLVITASSCTRSSLRRHLPKTVISCNINLIPALGVLRFDLDFRSDYLLRIILHLHHPAAAFFVGHPKRRAMGFQLDAGINFFLWLLKAPHCRDSFS